MSPGYRGAHAHATIGVLVSRLRNGPREAQELRLVDKFRETNGLPLFGLLRERECIRLSGTLSKAARSWSDARAMAQMVTRGVASVENQGRA